MQIVHAQERFPLTGNSALFLAGPTPRAPVGAPATPSWRQEALDILKNLNYKGDVMIPEPRHGWQPDYDAQVDWEIEGRERADIIVFWVPRELKLMPAFTTNVEYGEDLTTGKALYGRPDTAPKNKYLDALWKKQGHDRPHNDLTQLLADAVTNLKDGAVRSGAGRFVPLWIWNTKPFQMWLTHQVQSGHAIESFKPLKTLRDRPNLDAVTGWLASVTRSVETKHGRQEDNGIVFFHKGRFLSDFPEDQSL